MFYKIFKSLFLPATSLKFPKPSKFFERTSRIRRVTNPASQSIASPPGRGDHNVRSAVQEIRSPGVKKPNDRDLGVITVQNVARSFALGCVAMLIGLKVLYCTLFTPLDCLIDTESLKGKTVLVSGGCSGNSKIELEFNSKFIPDSI